MNNHSNKYSKDLQHSLGIGYCQPDFAVRVAQTKVRQLLHQVHEIAPIVRHHHIYSVNTRFQVSTSQVGNQFRTISNILIVVEVSTGLEVFTLYRWELATEVIYNCLLDSI